MAELVFNSAGVKAQEIDLSGPKPTTPQGTPAGVIGTSRKGPAFVPITLPNTSMFITTFGDTDGSKFAPLAIRQWFSNGAKAGTFLRVLGAGDGKRRVSSGENTGKVLRAGFVAGQRLVQKNGQPGNNESAGTVAGEYGLEGRTFLFGCFMSESSDTSTIFRSAGITEGSTGNGYEITGRYTAVTGSKPILRGVLITASGVIASLSGNVHSNCNVLQTKAARYDAGGGTLHGATYATATFGPRSAVDNAGDFNGDVNKTDNDAKDQFIVLLNGHKGGKYPSVLTCSFSPLEDSYFAGGKGMNRDPKDLEEKGHYLYANWNVYPQFAVVTGSQSALSGTDGYLTKVTAGDQAYVAKPHGVDIAFMVTASIGRNSGSKNDANNTTNAYGIPNFDGFEDRFQSAFSPYVTSQDMGSGALSLFRFHALSDGVGGYEPTNLDCPPERIKISIRNIKKSKSTVPGASQYGRFDVWVRDLHDNDMDVFTFEKWPDLTLDPTSDRYIARVIGDQRLYFNFDRDLGAQKLVLEGKYPNKSNLIRVEMDSAVDKGSSAMDPRVLPVGFRGPFHLMTSGSGIISAISGGDGQTGSPIDADVGHAYVTNIAALSSITQPPVPLRQSVALKSGGQMIKKTEFYWGVQTTRQDLLADPNSSTVHDDSVDSWTKYFPTYHTDFPNPWVGNNPGAANKAGAVLDCDTFCNNRFTLERVQVVTQSNTVNLPDAVEWAAARYRRDGILADLTKSDDGGTAATRSTQPGRFLNVEKDFGDAETRNYLKFSFFLQGGFNGLNIFDPQKNAMSDLAVRREFDDVTNQGGLLGPTLSAYRKAIDILGERADVDIQLLAIPGLRHPSITDYASDAVKSRFDAFYIMDIEEKDSDNKFVTASDKQLTEVGNTTRRFSDRNLDTSFAAAYFPDVRLNDEGTQTILTVPPTVSVLGAFALNDNVGHPWFAPAGFTRGALSQVLNVAVNLNQKNLDDLYSTDINPIQKYPDTQGPVIYGQKTLLKAQSALDRINVRRLLIEVRRRVRAVGDTILFEPNRAETLARFSAAVNPILKQIQQQQGVNRFKVQIDTTTTTQADIENNTIRGKIFLQPTKAVEFIALDFVITNSIDPDAL